MCGVRSGMITFLVPDALGKAESSVYLGLVLVIDLV